MLSLILGYLGFALLLAGAALGLAILHDKGPNEMPREAFGRYGRRSGQRLPPAIKG
jgi:hypothetical protein